MYTREAATIGEKTLFTYYSECYDNPRADYDNFGKMMCWHRQYNLGDEHEYAEPEDFLSALIKAHCDPREVFRYVKSGNAKEVRLRYSQSDRAWQLESLFQGKWYLEKSYPPGLSERSLPCGFVEEVEQFFTISEKLALLAETEGLLLLPLFLYEHGGITISASAFSCPWDSGQVGWVYASREDIVRAFGALTSKTIEKARNILLAEVETYDLHLRGEYYGYTTYIGGCEEDSCGGYLGAYDDFKEELSHELPEEWHPLVAALSPCHDDVANYFWNRRVAG